MLEGLLIFLPAMESDNSFPQARGKALQIIYQDILPMCGPNDINQFQEIQDVKKQEHPELNDAQLREVAEDYVHSILFAGHESATTTLTFAVKNLSENPDILRELKVGIIQIIEPSKIYFFFCMIPLAQSDKFAT